MKYMLLIQDNEREWDALPESEVRQVMGEYRQFTESIKASGHFLGAAQLQPTSTATCVRIRRGKRLVTDGPFAETHEQLGGYYVIEARDLDEAIGIAARVPSARLGTIEIRPVVESPAVSTY
jgi:hypothetical protein